jgi:hypothetical protein
MEIERDFKELLELLNSHEVEYIIVGGFALAFHGAPRLPVIWTFSSRPIQRMQSA